MPKSSQKTNLVKSNLIDLLKLKISIPGKLTDDDIRVLLHDLRSSANAFYMMVEDMELDPQNLTTQRQRTKYQQLQHHAMSTGKIIAKVCDAISKDLK